MSSNTLLKTLGAFCVLAASLVFAQAQVTATYTPNNWVVDPYSPNAVWGIAGPATSSPIYTNNGGNNANNMYGYSPIGSTITLANPGDTVTLNTQYTLTGSPNNANLQFRLGIVNKGASPSDTNWSGVLIGLPNVGGTGLYLENIPNSSVFSTGGSATIPGLAGTTYIGGSQAGPMNFTLSVTYLNSTTELISWAARGLPGNAYVFAGRYTNTSVAARGGFVFDTIGFLKGGSVFNGNSTANTMIFSNVTVTMGHFGDGTWATDASGLWSTTTNWANGVPANGDGFIADFSQVALTANRTVTLDSSRTVGSLLFGATSGSLNNWFLASSGGGSLTLDNYETTNFPGSVAVNQNTATLNAAIISTNGLTESGPGTLVLAGNNTIVGPLNLNGGELNFASTANLPLTNTGITAINFNGGGLQWAPGNSFDISAPGIPITFPGTGTFDTGTNKVTLGSGFGDGGIGGLTKLGAGTLTLNAIDYYSGSTIISNGTLALGSVSLLVGTTNIVVLPGSVFDVSAIAGNFAYNGSLSGAGRINGNITDQTSGVTGAGFLATGTAGTLTVNGNMTLVGNDSLTFGLTNLTAVGGGTNDLIAVSGALNIQGPVTVNVNLVAGAPGLGTYILFTYGSFSGNVANIIPPLGFAVVNNTAGKTISLSVTHVPQAITWAGDGINNTWDTATTANWREAGSPVDFNIGDNVTFDNTGSDSPAINISAGVSPGSLTVNASESYDFAGVGEITTGKLTKAGAGTLMLENANTYAGPTVISNGVLQIGGPVNGGATGTLGASPVTNFGALVFALAQNYTVPANIYGTGAISNIGSGGTITLSGRVSGGVLSQASAAAGMILSSSNTYTGPTLVSAGVLQAANALALSTNTASVSNGAQLYITANVNVTNKLFLSGTGPSASGALRKGGNGITTLYGVVALNADSQIQVDGGSTLYLTNTAGVTGSTNNTTSTNLILGAAANGAGTIVGPLNLGVGSLTVQGAGAWTIAPTNTYTGLTAINGGTLIITSTNALGPVSTFTPNYVTLGGGILEVTNNVAFTDGLRGFTAQGTAGGFDVASGATLTISNQITGSGTLSKSDAGTLVLAGSNSFAGTLDVDSANNVNNDGVLLVAHPFAITNVVSPIALRNTLGGVSTLAFSGSNGNIIVTQNITVSGRSPNVADILNVGGTNTLAGNLINGGTGGRYIVESDAGLLSLGSPATSVSFTTADPQTLTLRGSGAMIVLGVISDSTNAAGALTGIEKDGTGPLTLAALNTYSGATAITGGAVTVTGAIAQGTNAQTVTVSGGSLGGTGIINASVNVTAAGTLSPGAPDGILTINSNLTLAGNTFVQINKTTGARSQVAGLSGVTYGGTLTVTNVSGTLAPGDHFQIFPAIASASGSFASISGPDGVTFTFNPSTGVLTVASVVSVTPPNITFSASAGHLQFSWPSDHLGWTLQTNSINVAVPADWFAYPGSTTITNVSIPVSTNGDVYFRLYHP
jgi:autotransporter-associated beta strand protein